MEFPQASLEGLFQLSPDELDFQSSPELDEAHLSLLEDELPQLLEEYSGDWVGSRVGLRVL